MLRLPLAPDSTFFTILESDALIHKEYFRLMLVKAARLSERERRWRIYRPIVLTLRWNHLSMWFCRGNTVNLTLLDLTGI